MIIYLRQCSNPIINFLKLFNQSRGVRSQEKLVLYWDGHNPIASEPLVTVV